MRAMLAEACGRLIKDERLRRGFKQDELARRARVSRAVLSRLEQGKAPAVQSDTLDRLLAALELTPRLAASGADGARRLARLEQDLARREQRERHLRLALRLAEDPSAAGAMVAKARSRVALWRENRACSPFYIERWSRLLALPPRQLAKRMASLGEWQDAMFQNSPWSRAWT